MAQRFFISSNRPSDKFIRTPVALHVAFAEHNRTVTNNGIYFTGQGKDGKIAFLCLFNKELIRYVQVKLEVNRPHII